METTTPLEWAHAVGDQTATLVERSIGEELAAAAGDAADVLALVEAMPDGSTGRTWTFAELHAQAVSGARALLTMASPGDTVALWANNQPEWVLVQMSAALAGVTLVTVNPALRESEAEHVLGQSGAVGVVHVDTYRGFDVAACVQRLSSRLTALSWTVPIETWVEAAARAGAPAELPVVAPGDIAQIQYTSGTTGMPKGVLLHHLGLLNNTRLAWVEQLPFRRGAAMVNSMPLFHTAGSAMMVLGCLQARSTLVLMPHFDPALQLSLIASHRSPLLTGVPTMLHAMLDHPIRSELDLGCLEFSISGGAFVEPTLVDKVDELLGIPLIIIYAQTETSPGITITRLDDSHDDRRDTVGTTLPLSEVKLVEPGGTATVRIGEVGELCTRGYHVMSGYHDAPEDTAATIDADGWLHTGDLATMDERGYVRIAGRLKEMIIRGGENIYPSEIETALSRHPAVAEAAVVGLPDSYWGEEVAAFVRPATGASFGPEDLTTFLRGRLASHKVPKHWYIVEQFPLTASGKILKRELRARAAAGSAG